VKTFDFKQTGIIRYNPPRPGLKKKPDWWVVVNTDEDITRYYRWWVEKELGVKLAKPSWGSHISIIRGEKPYPDMMHLWDKYEGLQVEFEYSHNVRISGDSTGWDRPDNYWFVDVNFPFGIEMRKEFGYKYDFGLHITIGRTW
jgi:hypothetical protein